MSLPVLSFTFLNNFENCPRKAQHIYVLKDLPKQPETPEMKWGNQVHKAFEHRLRANVPLPADMQEYEPFAAAVENADGKKLVEENLAITAGGTATEFFGKDVFIRGKVDVAIIRDNTAMVIDWKTGKPREEPFEMEVFGLMLKCKYPGITTVTGRYVWLKTNELGKQHDLSNFARTYNELRVRAKQIESMPEGAGWPATPNPLCGWCPVKKCEFNKS